MSLVGQQVCVGDRLYNNTPHTLKSGSGTHESKGVIYSSVTGIVGLEGLDSEVLTVSSEKHKRLIGQVIDVGQIVVCKVTRIASQQATVEILAVDDHWLTESNAGLIRKEDVRPTTTDTVELYDSFRPNDIISARVISLGDSRQYFLGTGENELGVVRATCVGSGEVMRPISFREMECPVTGARELRKCAKPAEVNE
jgi:exosome complex component CSL4